MNEPFRWIDSIAAKVYAVLVLLCGLAFLFLAYVFFGTMHVSEAAVYPLVPGLILVASSVFIWRGAMWAMLLVAVCVLGFVLFVVQDDRSFLVLLAVPAIFGILTAVCIVCRSKSQAR
jgi:hypothetical protein